MKLTGGALLEKVFAKEIERYGTFDLSEIQETDGVTCYNEEESHDGWWIDNDVTFRYEGKKYGFNYRNHVSTADSEWYIDSFYEVEEADNEATNEINKLIRYIEEDSIGTIEEIIEGLENIKKIINEGV